MLKITVFVLASSLAIVACKRTPPGAGRSCREACSHQDLAIREMNKDFAEASRVATELQGIEVKGDADIKLEGDHARSLCEAIKTRLAHGHGIALALGDRDGALGADDARSACAGRSPAQIKSTLLPLRTPAPSTFDISACEAKCGGD